MDGAILLIDRDLGLLFWLGRVLDHAGYAAFPARSVPDAAALINDLHLNIGMLIVDCSLPGTEEFIATVRQSTRFLKVVCLSGVGQHICIKGVDAFCPKPVGWDDRSQAEWVKAVRDVLAMPVAS